MEALGVPAPMRVTPVALTPLLLADIATISIATLQAQHGEVAVLPALAALVPPPASVVLQEVGVVLKPEHAAPVAHGVHTEAVLQADIANAV